MVVLGPDEVIFGPRKFAGNFQGGFPISPLKLILLPLQGATPFPQRCLVTTFLYVLDRRVWSIKQ